MSICFGPFVLDLAARQLSGEAGAIHLSPKAFDLLATLVEARPRVIAKADLQKQLWPDTFVAEANLSNLISEVRQALDDPPRNPRYIRTAHRVGYAFCADVTSASPQGRRGALCWIEWGSARFPLYPGEHVIGRDPDAAIRLDASTVSRRHARLVVGRDGVRLEDFGSKNGTYRGGVRVTAPIALTDGDAIRIGSQLITFRARAFDSTETQIETLL